MTRRTVDISIHVIVIPSPLRGASPLTWLTARYPKPYSP